MGLDRISFPDTKSRSTARKRRCQFSLGAARMLSENRHIHVLLCSGIQYRDGSSSLRWLTTRLAGLACHPGVPHGRCGKEPEGSVGAEASTLGSSTHRRKVPVSFNQHAL